MRQKFYPVEVGFARFDPFSTRMASATINQIPDHSHQSWIRSAPVNSGSNKYFAVTFTEVWNNIGRIKLPCVR